MWQLTPVSSKQYLNVLQAKYVELVNNTLFSFCNHLYNVAAVLFSPLGLVGLGSPAMLTSVNRSRKHAFNLKFYFIKSRFEKSAQSNYMTFVLNNDRWKTPFKVTSAALWILFATGCTWGCYLMTVIITVNWHYGHLSLSGSALICITTRSMRPPEGTRHPLNRPRTIRRLRSFPAHSSLQSLLALLPLYDRSTSRKGIMDSRETMEDMPLSPDFIFPTLKRIQRWALRQREEPGFEGELSAMMISFSSGTDWPAGNEWGRVSDRSPGLSSGSQRLRGAWNSG